MNIEEICLQEKTSLKVVYIGHPDNPIVSSLIEKGVEVVNSKPETLSHLIEYNQAMVVMLGEGTNAETYRHIRDIAKTNLSPLKIALVGNTNFKEAEKQYDIINNGETLFISTLNIDKEQILNNLRFAYNFSQSEQSRTVDPMTKLYSRGAIESKLKDLWEHISVREQQRRKSDYKNDFENSLTLGYFDLDYFKRINDLFGLDTGDRVIKCMANAIKEIFQRQHTDFLGRMGGEEFILVIENTPEEEVKNKLKELKGYFRGSCQFSEYEKMALRGRNPGTDYQTFSAGVIFYNPQELSQEELLLTQEIFDPILLKMGAEAGCKKIKNEGGNNVYFRNLTTVVREYGSELVKQGKTFLSEQLFNEKQRDSRAPSLEKQL